MIGISEVIQTIGAMIIFSLLLLTSNRMIQMNTVSEVETEAVGLATTIAQSIIKEAQTKAFDDSTANGSIPLKIPEDFSTVGKDDSETSRSNFDDFDDYDGYEQNINTKFGNDSFHVVVNVCYVSDSDFEECTTVKTVFKKMTVTVTGDYLENEIQLSYLRRFYKTTD